MAHNRNEKGITTCMGMLKIAQALVADHWGRGAHTLAEREAWLIRAISPKKPPWPIRDTSPIVSTSTTHSPRSST